MPSKFESLALVSSPAQSRPRPLCDEDRQQLESALGPDARHPTTIDTKRRMYQEYCRGESVDALAARFHRTRASVYRVIHEMRAERIMALPLDYVPNEHFAHVRSEKGEQEIIQPPPQDEQWKKPRVPSGLPPYLASLYEIPLLTPAQEAHLFRQMNYLKYKAARLRKQLDPRCPDRLVMDRIEKYYDQAVAAKNWIIRANLRLVVSIAKRQFGPGETFFELVSDGNMSLMRAVEKFDFARGYKFSTYASWAIMKNFARTIPDRFRHCDRFRTSQSEAFEGATDVRPDAREQERAQSQREAQVARILARLDPREQKIIIRRYGLHRGREPLTLKQVGAEMGVTKERIRQIQARALGKLRQAADEQKIEVPT
jgi:RNA polymerase primary sigma factor/RNA polymerase sigma factor